MKPIERDPVADIKLIDWIEYREVHGEQVMVITYTPQPTPAYKAIHWNRPQFATRNEK